VSAGGGTYVRHGKHASDTGGRGGHDGGGVLRDSTNTHTSR
jgi:hypothetical protein